MARLTFPDEGSRSSFRTAPNGRPLTSAAGAAALVYLDAGATTLADIQTTAGVAIAGSSLNLDAYSRFPLFLGPADGTDTLYVVVDGGPVSPMYARVDDRLDAVKATADAAETPAGAAAKVSAEAATRAAADSAEATARAAAVTAAQAAAVQRSNHTGTQLAATVSDFSTAVVTAASGAYDPLLTPTATKTGAYTAAVGDLAMMNVAGGATALALPSAPADKAHVGYRAIGATSTAPLTVTAGGTDTIGTSGATTASVALADEVAVLQYQASTGRWLAVSNVKTQASLDGRYPSLKTGVVALGAGQVMGTNDRITLEVARYGMQLQHTNDLTSTQPYDLIDLVYKGTGDGFYVMHAGGKAPGYAGAVGGMAAFNFTIPYYKDDLLGSGRGGSVVNDKLASVGFAAVVQTAANQSRAAVMYSSSDAEALYIQNQDPAYPRGHGPAIKIDENGNGTSSTIKIARLVAQTVNATATGTALIDVTDTMAGTNNVLAIRDATTTRLRIDATGALYWNVTGAGTNARLDTAGAQNTIRLSGDTFMLKAQLQPDATFVATGAGSAALGANCPAATPAAPNTWWKVKNSSGTTGYIPIWT